MSQLFRFLFRRRGDKDEQTIQNLPWLIAPSILLSIRKDIDLSTGRLKPGKGALPDEERRTSDIKMRWAAGALDGVFGHHAGSNHDPILAKKIASLVIEISRTNNDEAKIQLYKILLRDDLLIYIDLAIKEIVNSGIQPFPNLHQFTSFLIHESPDRGPVKFAIALLGAMHAESEVDTIATLGCHEEFTLYAAVAIANILKNPEKCLWQLAQKVEGWGKIHLVERLSHTNDAQIKNWLLREGFRNNIMNEYLAYACATGGGLREALEGEIDDDLLLSAGEIIEALINGGPAEDIEDYDDAPYVLESYIRHLEPYANRLEQYLVVQSIYHYVTKVLRDPIERNEKGWSEEQYFKVVSSSNRILNDVLWRERVNEGLSSNNDTHFYLADRVARLMGLDVWNKHWERLLASPTSSHLWFYVMRDANLEQAQQAVDFASSVLPLEEIAIGPEEGLKFAPQYSIHACLDRILQKLGEFPRIGWELVKVGLKSPLIHNRIMAVRVMGRWGRVNWNDDMNRSLADAYSIEPVEKVREIMQQVIKDETAG